MIGHVDCEWVPASHACVASACVPRSGVYIPFVDPAMPAPQAAVCWWSSATSPILEAVSEHTKPGSPADLCIGACYAARHVVIGPTGQQDIILRDAERALTLRLQGSRATLAPINAIFLVRGIPQPQQVAAEFATLAHLLRSPRRDVQRSRERLFLRDALVAVDGYDAGATYRDTAAVIYGSERANTAWASASTAMKERMRRALTKGEEYRDGAYKEFLA